MQRLPRNQKDFLRSKLCPLTKTPSKSDKSLEAHVTTVGWKNGDVFSLRDGRADGFKRLTKKSLNEAKESAFSANSLTSKPYLEMNPGINLSAFRLAHAITVPAGEPRPFYGEPKDQATKWITVYPAATTFRHKLARSVFASSDGQSIRSDLRSLFCADRGVFVLSSHSSFIQKERSYLEANKKPITNVQLCFYLRCFVLISVEQRGKLLTRSLGKVIQRVVQ